MSFKNSSPAVNLSLLCSDSSGPVHRSVGLHSADIWSSLSGQSVANMEEANKLVGAGKKYLVMGKVVEAVSALQEACDLL